ncbi:hypothetical protein AB0H43_36705 [Hamadaea sp. NPDC050747]|uniref:hypothetical protein n=1 Tax=Hamadaea sp. NPDC050747 TaxID=3155789 RepID=UPI0033E81B52
MAWVEKIAGDRFRVRHRVDGRIVTDSTHHSEAAAQLRARDLKAETRLARLLAERGVPTLGQWTHSWLFSYLASETALAWNPDYLQVVILPRLRQLPLDPVTRQAMEDLVWQVINTWDPATTTASRDAGPVAPVFYPPPDRPGRARRKPWYARR